MKRVVKWLPWIDAGLEHLELLEDAHGVQADAVVLRTDGDAPFRLHYNLRCDTSYRVRAVTARLLDGSNRALVLHADGGGTWTDGAGRALPELSGCVDVDLSATPFTNTLPIRRLELAPGRAAEIRVAYVAVPEMLVTAMMQRYTCLERSAQGARYRYDGPIGEFSAELRVDADGLVVEYQDLFRRV